MVAFIPIGLCLIWLVLSWWRSHLRDPDPLVRQARAFAALREIAEHPRTPTHVVDHPADDAVNENVRILASPPDSVQRQRRPATAARRRTTYGPVIPADIRPTAAILPAIPRTYLARGPESCATTAPPLDAGTAVPARWVFETHDVSSRRAPARYVRALAATAAALAAGVIAVAALTQADGPARRPTPAEHASPRPSAPPTARAHAAALPARPQPLSLVMNPSGPTVPVKLPFKLTLHATADCWVQVRTTDGRTLFEATLLPGRDEVLHATAPLLVRLGNSPGIAIEVNAQPLAFRNLPQVVDVHFAS